ncbi:phosphotransferase family protein [Paenibacillus spongiae]|uniref:Aminoglycoside phosphotransferase family protein n=1 Tax=Paenibacillus spongiae TaxID=2909671 RepID=A0ABY5S6C2_9BACL|nr:aminoglycoside phosphotransferase family protein [Paenibacillus spongiae]UVI29447.1 aminoglycoside phosphotransferase family protein [Paenibacillus spongiae]
MKDHEVQLVEETIKRHVSSEAAVISIESRPIGMGLQAVDLVRHNVRLQVNQEEIGISLITKKATYIERSTISLLFSQSANVPYSLSSHPDSLDRSLMCIQDVDYETDYSKLDIDALQQKEMQALACIHRTNIGKEAALPWLPRVDQAHISEMLNTRWKPSWEAAKDNQAFIEEFGAYTVSAIEETAHHIVKDIEAVIQDERTYTLIHNDLNPGNVLVHRNEEVYFIDWEEARYGSLFFDIPLRCSSLKLANDYRDLLCSLGIEIPQTRYEQLFAIASRYLGIRYMSWNLSAWQHNQQAKNDLKKYIGMVIDPLF